MSALVLCPNVFVSMAGSRVEEKLKTAESIRAYDVRAVVSFREVKCSADCDTLSCKDGGLLVKAVSLCLC